MAVLDLERLPASMSYIDNTIFCVRRIPFVKVFTIAPNKLTSVPGQAEFSFCPPPASTFPPRIRLPSTKPPPGSSSSFFSADGRPPVQPHSHGKGRLPNFLKFGQSHKHSYHIVVMGAQDVGKTALVVRFLTRKYLSEYAHGASTSYERSVALDGKILPLRITDASGKESFTSLKGQGILEDADGFFVAYSITDKRSFFKAKEMLKLLNEDFDARKPVVLVANKDDLGHFRKVNGVEGQRISLTYPRCAYHECSAAIDACNVDAAFQDLLRTILVSKEGSKRHNSPLSALRPSKPRRYSAGNSTLTAWWRKSRCSSVGETQQAHKDRTFTM